MGEMAEFEPPRVMFQRSSKQERAKMLAIAGAPGTPAQPGKHERAMIAPGAPVPAP